MRIFTGFLIAAMGLGACANEGQTETVEAPSPAYATIGSIEMSQAGIMADGAIIENLGGDFGWSEGPVWVPSMDAVLFTDVPGNAIWKFSDEAGLTEWMNPSGAVPPVPDHISSAGANGLVRFDEDHIIVPDHGNRALWKLNVNTRAKTELVSTFEGKRLNSPNDAILHDTGIIYFTDPPYGLKGQDDSPEKELDFNGVFALSPDGTMTIVDKTLTRPNGIILSPDQRTLYVANADPKDAKWMAYDVAADGAVSNRRELLNATADLEAGLKGNADGIAMAADGTLFATGPGGVIVISPTGERLGLISTGSRIANVAFGGEDGRELYMTSHTFLARTRTTVKGVGF